MAYVRAMAILCVVTMSVAGCGGGASAPAAPKAEASAGGASAAEAPASANSRYDAADVASDEVKAAANFAVAEQARRSGFTLTLGAIRRAEVQNVLVAANYRLCLDVDTEGSSEHALAVVMRDQGGQHTLTSWTNTPCE